MWLQVMASRNHPARGVPVSTTPVQARSSAWHGLLGWSRRGLLPGVGTQSIASQKVWPVVFGLLEALLTHAFPFVVGTDMCSPFSLNAFCLVTSKKCQGCLAVRSDSSSIVCTYLPMEKSPYKYDGWPHVTFGLKTSALS